MSASSSSIEESILREFSIKLPEGACISKTGEEIAKLPSPAAAKEAILNEDLRDLFEPALQKARESKLPVNILSCLPRDLTNCRSGATPNPALVMILSTRDATQPLRACGDLFEGEVPAGMTCTRNSTTRLLRLMVTDGVTEIPCVELSTLQVFTKKLPIPGEKLLLLGAQVRNGMIILDENNVKFLGGRADSLFDEYKMMTLAIQNRNAVVQTDAPKFSSLLVQVNDPNNKTTNYHQQSSSAANPGPSHQNNNNSNNKNQKSSQHQQKDQSRPSERTQQQQQQPSHKQNRQQQQQQPQRNHHQDPVATQSQPTMAIPAPRNRNNNNTNNQPQTNQGENIQQQHQQQQPQNYGRGGGFQRGGHHQNHYQNHHNQQFNNNNFQNNSHQQQQQQQQMQAAQGLFNWEPAQNQTQNNNNSQQQHHRHQATANRGNVDARALHRACNTGIEDLGW